MNSILRGLFMCDRAVVYGILGLQSTCNGSFEQMYYPAAPICWLSPTMFSRRIESWEQRKPDSGPKWLYFLNDHKTQVN